MATLLLDLVSELKDEDAIGEDDREGDSDALVVEPELTG